jgi:uracil-DNA glycosylase
MNAFDPSCRRCPRLAKNLTRVRREFPGYFAAPVPPFGDPRARLIVVGLAPGMHGANRTGRPFTGDFAGILLYDSLHRFGFSNRAESVSADDGLRLKGCRITNAVKCLPPENKPLPAEITLCNAFLATEISVLPAGTVLLALGTIAHNAVLKAVGLKASACKFGHGALHALPNGLRLVDSYHCSRYNTQTGRLTPAMFHSVIRKAQSLLNR